MQNQTAQNKEFHRALEKIRSINELLRAVGSPVEALKARAEQRGGILAVVVAGLPSTLAAAVVSAGIEDRVLTVGVASAVWATRMRYAAESLRHHVGEALKMDIAKVRVKVVRPRP